MVLNASIHLIFEPCKLHCYKNNQLQADHNAPTFLKRYTQNSCTEETTLSEKLPQNKTPFMLLERYGYDVFMMPYTYMTIILGLDTYSFYSENINCEHSTYVLNINYRIQSMPNERTNCHTRWQLALSHVCGTST